jgi:hypothetical protein
MDPFTLSTGVVGFLSLAFQITQILNDYVSRLKSAPQEAQTLLMEVTTLSLVLDQLVKFLQSEDAKGNSFNQTSVLCSVMMVCQSNIEGLYKKLDGVYGADKAKREKLHGVEMVARIFERLKWPFSKVECQQIVKTLHRCTQTFEFSLTVSK